MYNSNYYFDAVRRDVINEIVENYTEEELTRKLANENSKYDFIDNLNEELWVADSVTGNASGSYTFNREEAKRCVMKDTKVILQALAEFEVENDTIAEKFLAEDWEYFDVIARCYVLSGAITVAVNTVAKEYEVAANND